MAAFQRFDTGDTVGKALEIYESVRELATPDAAFDVRMPPVAPVLLYTDGACKGNPGPGGWAALVLPPKHTPQRPNPARLFGSAAITTNNKMELVAVIEGLKYLPDGEDVSVFSDSRYVVDTATQHLALWRASGGHRPIGKRPANWQLWLALAHETDRLNVRFQWVRGHANDPLNALADRLARRGMREAAIANAYAISADDCAELDAN